MSLTNTPDLETKRLILRKFTENDIDALFAIYSDKDANTYLPWFPLTSVEEAKRFFEERYARNYLRKEGYDYAICFKKDNIPIGYLNVSMEDSHDLGYGLRKEFWYQGIAAEAGRAVIDRLKKENMPYITATHDMYNSPSGDVMKKLGMQYQYSYEEQWMPKNRLVTFSMYQLNLDGNSDRVYRKYWDQASVRFQFPFPYDLDMAVVACRHIVEDNEPITYVSRGKDGSWLFLCNRQFQKEDAKVVTLYAVYRRDPSVGEIAKLPRNSCAERKQKGAEWQIRYK